MHRFEVPQINDNESGWGPAAPPEEFGDLPYAPFEKRAFVGRMADWSVRAEQYRERRFRDNRQPQVTNEAFTYQEEDTAGFSLVDTPPTPVVGVSLTRYNAGYVLTLRRHSICAWRDPNPDPV